MTSQGETLLSPAYGHTLHHVARRDLADAPNAQPDMPEILWRGAQRIVEVTDLEVAEAMRVIFECTHNSSEGGSGGGVAGKIPQRLPQNRRCAFWRKH